MAPLRTLLVGVSSPGYRSLALDYLEAAIRADLRLGDIVLARSEFPVTTDPWWIAYDILRMTPSPDVIAFPVLCWTARTVLETARIVKCALPKVRIVLGGPEVGPIAREVLEAHDYIDAVVRGEGEFAFCDLLHSWARGGDPAGIAGITVRDGKGIAEGPDRSLIENLDDIPSPFAGRTHAVDGSAYVETYRGCPHRCAYCYEGKGSTRIRSYSWDRIVSDIEAVASTPGMQSFSFIDPVFNLTSDRLERLADILEPWARRGIRLHTIEVDIERIDTAAAALLTRAGVASVETGPQTVGTAALETCRRTFDRDRFAAGVAACREAGISVECDLIVGLPGDSLRDVLDGIDFAIALNPGKVQISSLHVLPGTDLWQRSEELGLVFDREPPHELIATRDLTFNEIRRLEEFGNAATALYHARIEPERGR